MSAPSYHELLRDAEAAQRKRDEATQRLKQKKKEEEEEKRRALLNQHKRPKPTSDASVSAPPKPAQLGDLLATYKIPKKPMADTDDQPRSSYGNAGPIDRNRSNQSNGFSSRGLSSSTDSRPTASGHRASGSNDTRSNFENRSSSSSNRQAIGNDRPAVKNSNDHRSSRDSGTLRPDKPRSDVSQLDRSRSDRFSDKNGGSIDRSTDRQAVRTSDGRVNSKPDVRTQSAGSSLPQRSSTSHPKPTLTSNGSTLQNKVPELSKKPTQLSDEEKRRLARERAKAEEAKASANTTKTAEPVDDFFDILSTAKHKTVAPKPAPKPATSSRTLPTSSRSVAKPSLPTKPAASSSSSSRGAPSSARTTAPSRGPSNGTSRVGSTSASKASSSLSSKKPLPAQNNKSSTLNGANRPRPAAPPALSFAEMMRMAETNVKGGATPLDPPKTTTSNNSRPEASSSSKDKSNRVTSQSNSRLPSSAGRSTVTGRSSLPARNTLGNDRKPGNTPLASRKRNSSPPRDAPRSKFAKPNVETSRPGTQRPNGRINESQPARGFQRKPEPPSRRPDPYRSVPSRPDPSRSNNSYRAPPPSSQGRFDQRSRFKNARREYSEDEDEYDSMDDFIVSDGEEVPNTLLKNVVRTFCRSDEMTWKQREREIDLSRMEANYHQVATEESRSTRIARLEDMKEEQRGARKL